MRAAQTETRTRHTHHERKQTLDVRCRPTHVAPPVQHHARKHPPNQRRHHNPDPPTRRSTWPHPPASVTSPPLSNVPINATAVASTPSPRARPAARALTPARRRQPPQRRHHVLHRHSAGADVVHRPSPPQRRRSADCRAGWRSCAAPRLAAAAHQPLTRRSPAAFTRGERCGGGGPSRNSRLQAAATGRARPRCRGGMGAARAPESPPVVHAAGDGGRGRTQEQSTDRGGGAPPPGGSTSRHRRWRTHARCSAPARGLVRVAEPRPQEPGRQRNGNAGREAGRARARTRAAVRGCALHRGGGGRG